MALIAFQQPEKVLMLESTPTHGKFEFKPLEPGYGMTVGNALRRILLSSPEGFAINSIKIDGVSHEFATIPGVIEDVTNIILNLKKVRIKCLNPETLGESFSVSVNGKNSQQVTGEDLSKEMNDFEVINEELVICSLDRSASFTLHLTIDKGRGWVAAEEIQDTFSDPFQIAIDAIYTPITNVKLNVENTRVGRKTDYDKLTIEIDTDGSISPLNALRDAAAILIDHFRHFSEGDIEVDMVEEERQEVVYDKDSSRIRGLLNSKLEDVGLSVRALNCLRAADVETVGQLVSYTRSELLKFRNFGKKSLTEIEELYEKLDLTFGMDIDSYGIE